MVREIVVWIGGYLTLGAMAFVACYIVQLLVYDRRFNLRTLLILMMILSVLMGLFMSLVKWWR
jgi:hypothetical protein